MDSLTHAALGACLGELLLSKKLGKKALLWGAVAQNIPDIDVVAALWLPPYQNLLVHRGITHSFLFAFLFALLLTVAAFGWHKDRVVPWSQLFLFFLLQVTVHDLLDTCNAYGTGLLEPFTAERFSFHLLYVADPLFTFWLVLSLVVLLFKSFPQASRIKWALLGLVPAGLYLGFALFAKSQVQAQLTHSLQGQNIQPSKQFLTPTPFNALLWYSVAAVDSGYVIGYRSVVWPDSLPTGFVFYPQQEELLATVENRQEVAELVQFADDFYTVERWGDTLVFNVPRYGQMHGWQNPHARFAFHYYLNPALDNKLVMQRGRAKGWNRSLLRDLAVFVLRGPE
ncbi:MAG: metal-dependent hydrolase [Rufibacter sp.]